MKNKAKAEKLEVSLEEYLAEGDRLFGEDRDLWRFVCPGCGHVATLADYKKADAEGAAGFSCIGRFLPERRDWLKGKGPGPCNYSGGGLFNINPVVISGENTALFALEGMSLEDGAGTNEPN